MRSVTLKLMIAAILFVSLEGMADFVDETSFHQTHHAHAENADEWYPDTDGGDHQGDACEHFCHAHIVVLPSDIELIDVSQFQSFVAACPTRTTTLAAAPPTPPPNL